MNNNSFNTLPFYTDPSLRNACKLECKTGSGECGFYISTKRFLTPFLFCTDLLADVFTKEIKIYDTSDVLQDTIDIRTQKYDCDGKTYVYSNMDEIDAAFDLSAAQWGGTGDLATITIATLDATEFVVSNALLTQDKEYRLFYDSNGPLGDFEIFLTLNPGVPTLDQSLFDGNVSGPQVITFTPIFANTSLVFRYKAGPVDQFVVSNLSVTCPWTTEDLECGKILYATIETDAGPPTIFYSELFKAHETDHINCIFNKFTFSNPCDIQCWQLSLLDDMIAYLPACVENGTKEGESAANKPTYPVLVDGGDDEQENFVELFKRVDKTYPVLLNMIPEYLVDLVNNWPFFDNFAITRSNGAITTFEIIALDVDVAGDPTWQDAGCFADMRINVISQRISKSGCCDNVAAQGGGE